ncbi:MAG: hypothetical protein JNG90_19475 [Planctomycetaceae bacterium]|nr:hypothetical protein [Planctomycetaceae bacterium]
MPTTKATFNAGLTIKETFTANEFPAASANSPVTSSGFNETIELHASSTPPVTKAAIFKPTLVAAALTIDLTSLPQSGGGTFSASGLKLVAILFNNPGNNPVTIAPGGSNPYAINGGEDKVIQPKGSWLEYFGAGLSDVDGTHKELDLTGTGTDQFECEMLFG